MKKLICQGTSSGLFGHDSSSSSSTENLVLVDKPVLDAQLFRELKPEQALALLSFSGYSIDDILNVLPVYVD